MKLKSPYLIKPHTKVRLSSHSTSAHDGLNEGAAQAVFVEHRTRLEDLQERFYAAQSRSVLLVLQGMDTAGKDGTIKHIFSGVNPQGCQVASFKVPTPIEARHDFLWRCHAQVPPRGMIGIFNRSHYEDVLSPWVHGTLSDKQRRLRFKDINEWEQTLTDNGVVILKFFLHISHGEQTQRLQERIDTPSKHWKLSPADFEERPFWPKYQQAYEEILRHTSPKHAPWFVIPADHKWYRNLAISKILVDALSSMKLEYPVATFDPSGIKLGKESPKAAAKQVKIRTDREKRAPDADSMSYGKKSQ
ncbi:polyphosphate:nucleotide phosphotransferase, PPK2 family [Bryocella elongata]|uniref:Polyphosphate:nucleotide phosphotransferase, PPK2 family n=1 Tax=Bryocella elongata TaxID=863522 RepID=A0A1H5WED3_9BACT|nr:polyphosphate kinase 2 family protein [Bryocella elongata]SEF97740.1 polyphosphate:nucleotide phosphotransferase, PPK2 family [Bryocella elongata]